MVFLQGIQLNSLILQKINNFHRENLIPAYKTFMILIKTPAKGLLIYTFQENGLILILIHKAYQIEQIKIRVLLI